MQSLPTIPQITPRELKARLDAGDDLFLLDVRELQEREISHIGGEFIPKDTVVQNLERSPRDREVIVYCRSGGRSQWVAQELKGKHGFERVLNLSGGMLGWAKEVDGSVRVG